MVLERSLLVAVVGASVACATGRNEADDAGVGGAFVDTAPGIETGDGGPVDPRCPDETQYVFVIDSTGVLYRFDPPTVAFSRVGPIRCPGSVYSMAVDRKAFAWVVQPDGTLLKVDTRDGSCERTDFAPNQQGFSLTFGMGFSTNGPDTEEETLYVSDSDRHGLAMIDTQTLTLGKIGTYDKLQARAELTGTGDGRLFGAFEGSPYVVAEIDKEESRILSEAPQSAINYPPNGSNFAFAFWAGEFFLFVGPGTSTDVFRYSPETSSTTKISSVDFVIVGAGVSTCAPTVAPK